MQQGLTLGRRWVMLRKKRKDLTYTRRTGIIFLKMILGFRDKEAEMIYNQQFSRKLPQSIQKIALRKLIMIDKAESLQDLRIIWKCWEATERGSIVSVSTTNTESVSKWFREDSQM